MTLTTVCYGDFVPSSIPSKLFTAFYSLVGIGILLSLIGLLAGKYIEVHERTMDRVLDGSCIAFTPSSALEI